MKILMVNWAWYPSGGDWTYIENLSVLYKSKGHTLVPFSCLNDKNIASDHVDNFIPAKDFKKLERTRTLKDAVWTIKNSVVNNTAVVKLKTILKENPDIRVAHLHNIHHYITPAIIPLLKKNNVRVIWTLHDYKILCPDSLFVSESKVCEKCKGGKFFHCGVSKCKKGSSSASWLAAFDAYYYHYRGVYKMVDAFLCPSSFLRSKFIDFGFDEKKLFVTNLCYDIGALDKQLKLVQCQSENSEGKGKKEKYILYFGRIEKTKGIFTLLSAMEDLDIKLKIAGSGSEESSVKRYIEENSIDNVEFIGFQQKKQVYSLIQGSEFVVSPSEWYENFPFSIIESFLLSKPVVGARIGGIPELVIDGVTGYIFEPGDKYALKDKLSHLMANPSEIAVMGMNAREHVAKLIDFDGHWAKLENILNPQSK